MRITPLLLATTTALALVASLAVAADRRVEGTVKAVDPEKSTVTVSAKAGAAPKDETLDVVKKARITVNGKPATLKDVRRGQKAVAVFNTELEVVTRLDATGEGVAPMVPEVTTLRELPEAGHSGPWPSPDGLTLYWRTVPPAGGQEWIWSARRTTKEDLFEGARRLVPGIDPTVSADGLEMILLQGGSLWTATRPTPDATFARPRKIADLSGGGSLGGPNLSPDGLTLYGDRFQRDQAVIPVKLTRADRKARWAGPTPVKVSAPDGFRIRFFSVSPDGTRAFCCLRRPPFDGPPRFDQLEIAMMPAEGDGFGRPRVILVDGNPLHGLFPRHVPATRELLFVRIPEPDKPAEIALVRNFDPDAIETAPAAAVARPARPDREAIQGRWVSVSEEIGGKPLTREQIRDMNKRVEVRGDRFVIRRTGLGGKFGVYDGTFRLDPSSDPGTFDWAGKGPSGAALELRGIYQLDADALRLCYVEASSGATRPTELRSSEGSKRILIVFKRDGR